VLIVFQVTRTKVTIPSPVDVDEEGYEDVEKFWNAFTGSFYS
jgi:hypothetical protein